VAGVLERDRRKQMRRSRSGSLLKNANPRFK